MEGYGYNNSNGSRGQPPPTMRQYSFEDPANPFRDGSPSPPRSQRQSPPQEYDQQYTQPPQMTAYRPGAHPESVYNRMQAERSYGRVNPMQNEQDSRPPPPPHRSTAGRAQGQLGYTDSQYSHVTTGADNFGPQAAGGITGIAMGVADANARESGLEAERHTPAYSQGYAHQDMNSRMPPQQSAPTPLQPMASAAFPPGRGTPQYQDHTPSIHSSNESQYDPYLGNRDNRYSRNLDPSLAVFDPDMIEDDGDDGLEIPRNGRAAANSGPQNGTSGALAAGGLMGTIGGLVGRNASGNHSGTYDAVHNASTAYAGASDYHLGGAAKESEWLHKEESSQKKMRWTVGIILALLVIGGIVAGILLGVVFKHKSSNTTVSQGMSAANDTQANGDLNKNSAEIKALLNNPNLHKVFPGIDYTPMYTQYPGCLSYPASQNNVTRDLAVISQLTNTVRLYGTDCNQTELLMHSIDQLGLNGTIKVWLGIWQDSNATTNARQLEQFYNIVDAYGTEPFLGVIVGNEVLFRKDMTETQLVNVINGVRSNLTAKGQGMSVASSDLGDNWTQNFADAVDYVMANIHPFFAGVPASDAANWTTEFWQGHDVILKPEQSQNVISETGWPSTGGTDCGGATSCTNGSVASIAGMNQFMDDWVCQSLANNVSYFWFEAFDEPWKIVYDTPGENWEDKWGLLDVNRVLKSGVTIPSCGGKEVP